MAVSVAASWSGSYATPPGFFFPLAAARPLQVAVANTGGHWMAALVTWRQPLASAGAGVSVCLADDARNWWEPLGAPVADSSASGVTRTAIWVAPAARAAQWVQAAPTGPYLSLCVTILDLAGMQPWMTLTTIQSAFSNAATSLSLSAGPPSAQALLLTAAGTDSPGSLASGPGAGWTALPPVVTGSSPAAGAYVDGAALNTSGWTAGLAAWESVTGIPLPVTRWYAGTTYTIGTSLSQMAAAGTRILLDLSPPYNPVSPADRTSIATMLDSLRALGADVRVSLWHEPALSGLTAAQYVAMIQYYGPAVRARYQLWCVFSGSDTIEANGYYPGDGQVDGIAADCYATSTSDLANCQSMADNHGLGLGLWEVGAAFDLGISPSPVTGVTTAQGQAFFSAVQALFAARVTARKPVGDICFFSAAGSGSTGTANFLGDYLSQAAGFEGGIAHWVNSGNCAIAASGAWAHSGASSLALTATAAGNMSARPENIATSTTYAVPVTPGQQVSASAWWRAATVPRNVHADITWYSAALANLSTSNGTATADSATAATFTSVTATAPASSAWAVVHVQVDSAGGAGEVHYVDDVQVTVLPPATDHTAPVQFPWDWRIAALLAMQQALQQAPPGLMLAPAWQVTTLAATASWTLAYPAGAAAVMAGVLVSAAAPALPAPSWPVMITEAAIGGGPQVPPSRLSWTSLSSRKLATSVQQGRQYTLSQLQAGQGAMTFDNPDGALIPPGTGSFAGIDSGTPVRQRVIIPAVASPHYVAFSGYLKRWPFALPDTMLRGQTTAEVTDIWAYAAGTLSSIAREEMLLDQPYALWPLADPAGSAGGSNIAPGNGNPLTLVTSKYGTGGSTVTWAATPPGGPLLGDSSATVTASGKPGGAAGMWQQQLSVTALQAADGRYGYALGCYDNGYPPVSGGITIECWAQSTANANTTGAGFFNSGNTITVTGSNWANGTPVVFASAGPALPAGMTAGTIYYVIASSGATFQVSATAGGSAVALTSNSIGFAATTTAFNPAVMSARNVKGIVVQVSIRNTDGALLLTYQTAAGARTTVVIDTSLDYRLTALWHLSVAFNTASYRVLVNGGATATVAGVFSAPLAAYIDEAWYGGILDRQVTGYAFPGYLAMAGVWPGMLAQSRVVAHYWAALGAMKFDPADQRVDRLLEYAGIAGRRLILQQSQQYEADVLASGQDVGGQSAASSASNVAASTVPAMLYVAPTGDVTYQAKAYAWNNPVKWVLGDNVAGGEIPFLPQQFATDYDPARVVNDIQLSQLDTQSVTVPSGVMSAATIAAVEAASRAQYGDQPYQQAGYLQDDWSSAYNAGSGLTDLATWIASVYARPRNRVQAVQVQAAASAAGGSSPARWQFWGGASAGDMVQVILRLPTAATSPLISLMARITQTQRASQFSQDGASAVITCVLDFAPEYNALTCDDPVRGLLNGSNVLPW